MLLAYYFKDFRGPINLAKGFRANLGEHLAEFTAWFILKPNGIRSGCNYEKLTVK
jgi:hypothetical protein